MCGAGIWGERNSAIGLSFGPVIFVLGLKDGFQPDGGLCSAGWQIEQPRRGWRFNAADKHQILDESRREPFSVDLVDAGVKCGTGPANQLVELKAYRGRCPHADMPLNDAIFKEQTITCPHHQ
jgi:hypothetical protein